MLDCTVRATKNRNYQSVSSTMAAKLVQRSAVVIALLVLSTSGAAAQYYYYDKKMLFELFETALLNDTYGSLQTLQEIFFNPGSKQSPEKVRLSVSISVEDIADPECCDYDPDDMGPAFVYDDSSGTVMWYFNSYYELQQQVDDGISDTKELANLITNSGSAVVFYSFDPSFYSIMQTLSSSIALIFPAFEVNLDYRNDNAEIDIAISTELDGMPCWGEAVYALRSVLMWVSFNCSQNAMSCNFRSAG